MRKYKIIVYGAYGYTGKLISNQLKDKIQDVLLSGKNENKLRTLSDNTGFSFLAIDLQNKKNLTELFSQTEIVINAAGPFINTCCQIIEACIESKSHYIDINGDIKVFEIIKSYGEKATQAGVMILSGAGFDIVPSDCLAVKLKKMMTNPTHLKIAFATSGGGISHGTALTVLGRIGEKALKREDGKLKQISMGKNSMWVDFGEAKKFTINMSWGDVSTAYTSTGIENIETYMAVKPKIYYFLKLQFIFNWLLRLGIVRNMIKNYIDKNIVGPNEISREKAYSLFYAEIKNSSGHTMSARLKTDEGYNLTAKATVLIAKKVLNNDFKIGYQTPAKAYSENLIFEIEGTEEIYN